MATENVTATLVETTEMNGEPVYVVAIESTAEQAAQASSTIWVTTEDYKVLQMTATDGTNETTVEVTETQFNVSIHDSTFDPPTDRVSVTTTETYDSFDAVQSATELPLPEYTGEFTEATQLNRADGEAIIQQYDTTDGTVSVITATGAASYLHRLDSGTNVTVDGQSATAVERDGRATVVWTEDGVTTAVAVDGTIDDATTAPGDL